MKNQNPRFPTKVVIFNKRRPHEIRGYFIQSNYGVSLEFDNIAYFDSKVDAIILSDDLIDKAGCQAQNFRLN